MRKRACLLAIALLLTAGPVLAADRSDEQPAGLRAVVAWVLGLVGHGDVERTAPGVHQRTGLEINVGGEAAQDGPEVERTASGVHQRSGLEVHVGGEAAPPEDSDSTQQEPDTVPGGSV